MPELTDQQFDADAARQLKFNTMVTSSQQQKAKERLLRRASRQTILEPVAAIEPVTARTRALALRQRTVRIFNFLVMDSKAYERAYRPWRFSRYDTMRKRYMTIRMSV